MILLWLIVQVHLVVSSSSHRRRWFRRIALLQWRPWHDAPDTWIEQGNLRNPIRLILIL